MKILIIYFFAFCGIVNAAIIMKPYLMGISNGSVYVLVETSTADPVTIEYGLTTAYGFTATVSISSQTTASPVTYIQKIKLTGLLSDTVYHFRAVQLGVPATDSYFRSAPSPGKSFRFAWEADMRTNTAPHDQIAALINNANPVFLLQGGDVCGGSTYSYYKSEFFRTNELNVISHVPFVWAPGNHETWGTNTKAFSKAPESASGVEDYYSFDYGDIHFLILNTQISYTSGSAQYTFAENDLASTTKPWKIVLAHIPGYTASTDGHAESPAMIAMAQNIFVPNHVDLALYGHNHFYQHCKVSGLDHVTIGSAGAPLYTPGTASYVVKSVKDYCYGIFDYTPETLKLSVYNNVNALLDTLTFTKSQSTLSSTFPVSAGWNIVSVPLLTPNMSRQNLFSHANSPVFAYNNGYISVDTLQNSSAYWIRFAADESITVNGLKSQNRTVAVTAGWNFIGPFETDVQTSSIVSSPSGIVSSPYYGYAGGYTTATVLTAGKGYWVKVSSAGSLQFPAK